MGITNYLLTGMILQVPGYHGPSSTHHYRQDALCAQLAVSRDDRLLCNPMYQKKSTRRQVDIWFMVLCRWSKMSSICQKRSINDDNKTQLFPGWYPVVSNFCCVPLPPTKSWGEDEQASTFWELHVLHL